MESGVSVIIPTHNRAAMLARALDSVQGQSLQALEIIVVDDGSGDETGAMIAAAYSDIRYVHQAQAGVSAARNKGILTSTAPWLAFLDSDDTWHTDKLAVQMEHLGRRPHYRVAHTDEVWIRNGQRLAPKRQHRKYGGWIFQRCLPLCAISPSAAVIHRSVFDDVGLFDENLPACEDYDMWLRICASEQVLFIEQPLVIKYGGHSDQLSRIHWGMDRFRVKALTKILDQGVLTEIDQTATQATLKRKLMILMNGARKRHKYGDLVHYQALKERYCP